MEGGAVGLIRNWSITRVSNVYTYMKGNEGEGFIEITVKLLTKRTCWFVHYRKFALLSKNVLVPWEMTS